MRNKENLLIAAIFLSAAFFIGPEIASAEIIFNEVAYDLSGADDKHEWVELYNDGSSSIDLTDWKINDGDTATNHTLNAPPKNNSRGSLIIGAGEYILLADDAATIASDLPNYSGTIIDTVLNLSNTSAMLKLLNKEGVETSTANYNKDMGANGNGKTLEWSGSAFKEGLIDGGTPGAINSVLSSAATLTPTPTPTLSASPIPTPTPSLTPSKNFQYSQNILINEFLPYPAKDRKEWIELLNNDPSAIDLTGWQIDDDDNSTSPQTIPENTIIKPGELLVVSLNKSTLNNDGDKVQLLWPDDQIVHAVSYSKATQGQSCARFNNGWLWTSQPTPGQTNKKSFSTNNSSANVALAAAEKINPIEESVLVESKTTNQPYATPKITASAKPTPEPQTSTPNLTASVSSPTKESSKLKTAFVLVAVLLLAGLAATGLVYFRRKLQVDSPSPDD